MLSSKSNFPQHQQTVPNSNPNFEHGAAHLHTSSCARLDSNFDKMAGEIIVRIGTTESEFS
jgi:hypothetical protein